MSHKDDSMEIHGAGSDDLIIPWKVRADLQLVRRDDQEWIVRDSMTLNNTLLSEIEYFILNQLTGRTTRQQLLERVRLECRDPSVSENDVDDILLQFRQQQLIQPVVSGLTGPTVNAPNQGAWRQTIRTIARCLRFQIPLTDPAPWLNACRPYLVRPFIRQLFCVSIIVAGLLLMALLARLGTFVDSLPAPAEFFGPANAVWLLSAFVIVKLLHEVGHMLTAGYYGVECHEAGLMFLFMTPVMYTNVSDAARLPSRQRATVAAAGILVELMIAAVAFLLWWFAAPGLVRSLMANVVCICTVGTVLFNGNPLLRYDGYFVLSDLAKVPNLSDLGGRRVRQILEWCFTGASLPEQRFRRLHWSQQWLVTVWGFCSVIWRVLMAVTLLRWLPGLFELWGLRSAGLLLTFALIVPLAAPVLNTVLGIMAISLHTNGKMPYRPIAVTALLIVLVLIPLPCSVVIPATLEPDGHPHYLTIPGRLAASADYGTDASVDLPLATFRSDELERQRLQLAGEVQELTAILRALEIQNDARTLLALPATRESLQHASSRLKDIETELQRLTIVATTAGQLIPPRPVPVVNDEESLPGWRGVPLSGKNFGVWMEAGTSLGVISSGKAARLRLAVSDRDLPQIREGQKLEFLFLGAEGPRLDGKLLSVSALPIREPVQELIAEGLVPPISTTGNNISRYQAVGELTLPAGGLARGFYQAGLVRIRIQPQSILTRSIRLLRDAFL